jgi:hypothetical protein
MLRTEFSEQLIAELKNVDTFNTKKFHIEFLQKKKELQAIGVTRFTGLKLMNYKALFDENNELLSEAVDELVPTARNSKR